MILSIQLSILFPLIYLCTLAKSQNCNTPEEWLSGDPLIQKGVGYLIPIDKFDSENGPPNLWPNGVVKYKLHSSLTSKDRSEVQKAFEEYHKKTCIRFQPWATGDRDFVSIEVNNNVCGKAHVCKIGGYQFATFGKNCRNVTTMVHQLGHTLCHGHKNQQITSTFTSVLDIDAVNALYKCRVGECHRHRWVPAASLSHEDKINMQSFGYETKDGSPIYPCRALANGEFRAGMYDDSKKTCQIADESQVHKVSNDVEVLTIPGGLREDCNVYSLVDKANALLNNALQVGGSLKHARWTSHIAYASITKADGGIENAVGNVWADENKGFENVTEMTVGSVVHKANEYKILTCNLDTACMVMQWYEDSKGCN